MTFGDVDFLCKPLGEEDVLIIVKEKTNRIKYEYLRAYYTLWNSITFPEYRVIVDCYAGTGHVIYEKRNGSQKKIYGSPLLAILKTIEKSSNLSKIINEMEISRFNYLQNVINDVLKNGIPIFVENIPQKTFFHPITNMVKKIRLPNRKPRKIYPDEVNQKLPRGFIEKKKKTKTNIVMKNINAKDLLEEVFNNHSFHI